MPRATARIEGKAMSSGSVRLHVPVDLHQHDDPPESDRPALPDARSGDDGDGAAAHPDGRLWREDGRVMYQDASMEKPEPVRIVWARPLSGRGGPVSVMRAGKKREIAFFPDLNALPDESRRIALEELDAGMVMPKILVINQVKPRFGNYYWDVDTDLGKRRFLLSSPENNSFRPKEDTIVIRDVSGNCYEISRVSALDAASRGEMDRAL